jgi:dTMP kinase
VRGKLIVIEGTDGSGKATQSKELLHRFEEKGVETAYVDFPQYEEKSAGLVANYLNGKYGSADEVPPKIASMFYAVDRYDASFGMRKALEEGRIIISNRYVSASMGHQTGKLADPKERDDYLNWLDDLEFNFFGIPRPDLTILLFVPITISQKLIENKGHRAYIGGKKKDIHEADEEHLKQAEQAYLEVAKKYGWTTIDCTDNGKLLSIEEIHVKVWKVVNDFLGEQK